MPAALQAFLHAHKTALLASGGAVAVGAGLYARHVNAGASTAGTAATVTPQTGTDTATGSSTANGPGIDSDLATIGGILNQIATGQSALPAQIAAALPPSLPATPPGGYTAPHISTPAPAPKPAPKPAKPTPRAAPKSVVTSNQTGKYLIEEVAGKFADVTANGTIHNLTPTELTRDLAAGAGVIKPAAFGTRSQAQITRDIQAGAKKTGKIQLVKQLNR